MSVTFASFVSCCFERIVIITAPLMNFSDEIKWLLEEIIGQRYNYKVEANTKPPPLSSASRFKNIVVKKIFHALGY
ncbi:MAG TPA: hypothetical protein VEY10_02245 [Flavisolibacter sp.]|jgi:hypothetical protein|nr:hypothetical protein [Flavisolibacter sp.]